MVVRMRHLVSLLLVGLMLGVTLSGAISLGEVFAASTGKENDAYTQFWSILYREAWLVEKVNSSANSGHLNVTATKELISNSQAGEKNAANISAGIWLALQELKKSGVKLKYSAKDLKQMAEEIKKNGLPAETVKELKSQGWTDEEIKALEDYIVKNADNITTGFDMESFLENFSTAFVEVGFKYAEYESWALEEWKWGHPNETQKDAEKKFGGDSKKVVPSLSDVWVSFYEAYAKGDVSGMKSSISSLFSGIKGIIYSSQDPSPSNPAPHRPYSYIVIVDGGGLIFNNVDIWALEGTSDKGDGFESTQDGTALSDSGSDGYSYYWPLALKAYNLTRQIYVIVEAMSQGNKNPKLQGLLNQKVAELKDALVVYYHSNEGANPRDVVLESSGEPQDVADDLNLNGNSGTGDTEKTSLKEFALNPNNNYGYIKIVGIDVVPVDITTTYATYKVVVHFQAVHNVVEDIKIAFQGTGLSSTVDAGYLHPNDGVKTVSSIVSSKISGEGKSSVSVAGTVTITGKSSPTPVPTSGSGDSEAGEIGVKTVTVSESYHKVISLKSTIDPSKVTFVVFTDPQSPVHVGSNVEFKIYVYNGNDKAISANYRLDIQCPTSPGHSATYTNYTKKGSISLAPNSGKTITVTAISFDGTGSYGYSGTLYFGQYSKTSAGTLDVTGTALKGANITILGVSVSPSPAKAGKPVTFTVKLKNNYNVKKTADVTVYLGDSLKQSKTVSIAAHATASLTLQLLPRNSGDYRWNVQVHTSNNGNSILEDSRMGELSIVQDSGTKMGLEIKCPSRVGLGDSFECLLQVDNDNPETIEVQLNNITFRGEVKHEEADINYVRFQGVKGTFYLSAFKEVPPHSSRNIPINLGRVDNEFASHFGLSDNHLLLSSTVQGDVNPNLLYQVAYWDTEYSITLRLDVFDKNGGVLFKDKILTTSTIFFYDGSTQAKIDHKMRVQRLENFVKTSGKVIFAIILVKSGGDKLWNIVKYFWG